MKRTMNAGEAKGRSKVFWTDTEKKAVILRAAAIHSDSPDLAGLPLIREAMLVLPPGRRRKVIALSQVLWFEDGLAAELKRQADERRSNDSLIAVTRHHHRTIEEWVAEDAAWKGKIMAMQDQMVALLVQILGEMKALNGSHADQNKSNINGRRK